MDDDDDDDAIDAEDTPPAREGAQLWTVLSDHPSLVTCRFLCLHPLHRPIRSNRRQEDEGCKVDQEAKRWW